MKIKDFVEGYEKVVSDKLKANYIKDKLEVKDYVPFAEKVNLVENVVKTTTYERDSNGELTGNIKINSIARALLFGLSIIDKYTNLEVDFKHASSEYDLLCKSNLFASVNELIPEKELKELQGMMDMVFNDTLQNELSTQRFVSNQVNRFSKLIELSFKPVLDKIADEIENMDESKVEAIGKQLEKFVKRVK
jgi:hypothetical protein